MYRFRVKTVAPARIAVMRARSGPADFGPTLRLVLETVWRHLGCMESVTVGPALARYLTISADTIEFEAGFPVAEPITETDDVRLAELPGGRAATAIHHGSYAGLPDAYQALRDWMDLGGLEPAGPPYDIYWADTSQVDNEAELRTEIVWPIRDETRNMEPR